MYATTGFPHHVHWSPVELADAVPRRLSELFRQELAPQARPSADADAIAMTRRARSAHVRYVPTSSLPELFRVD